MDQPYPSPDSFGALLSSHRKERHWTQQRLAGAVGVGRNTIGRWERGDFLPESKGMVLELARHLHLDDQETRHLLEASLTALAPYWGVPLPRNPFFTGREEILEILHAHLTLNQRGALTPSYALQGLGGVGKTQIALEYAYRHALEYRAVFWVEAETHETALSSLVQMAEVLQLPERQEPNQQRVVAAVQRWLSSHNGWLLIWDNLEELELLPRLLPAVREGANLLTTRCQALGTLARGIDVAPMQPEEGIWLVLRRANVLEAGGTDAHLQQLAAERPGEYAAARELVTTLGGLPLALDQAGAYIEETGCSHADYLLRYRQQRQHLLDRRGMARANHPLSVAATLGLAGQQVAAQHPAALELLRFCACLYPEAIPEELLLAGANLVGPVLGPVVADLAALDAALLTLRKFSLVQRQPDPHTLSLHRLVQVLVQDGMSAPEHAAWQQRAVQVLNHVFPDSSLYASVDTWQIYERLLPQVLTCVDTLPAQLQDQALAEVLLKAADYVCWRVRRAEAEPLYQRALQIAEQQVGESHPLAGSCLHKLALLYLTLGRYAEAEPLYQRALSLLERAVGLEHPEVAFPLQGLALVFRQQGKYEQAVPFCLRALRVREQALGEAHLQVAETLNCLGLLSYEQGRYDQAETAYQRALRLWEQTLGETHPRLAIPLNNLGALSLEQGKYEQAESFCLRAVSLFEEAMGPDHPDLAYMLDTLATLYGEMGRYDQAEPLHRRALHLIEQDMGSDHPMVAYSLQGLGLLCRKQGKFEEAEAWYHQALQIREQRRGSHHPETAHTLAELARLRQQQGRLDEALALAERAQQICVQSLGEAHPKTSAMKDLYIQLVEALTCALPDQSAEANSSVCQDQSQPEQSVGRHPLVQYEAGDQVQGFLRTCCELHPRAWTRSADLWLTYERWGEENQERFPLSRSAFSTLLKAHGCYADRTKTARIWRGIAIVKQR